MRADLLAKIKKCLAMAAGAREHEAAAALGRARELMDLYGVDESDLVLLDVGEATSRGGRALRPPLWEIVLISSVTRAIPTKALLGPDGVVFVGLLPAPEIASYAFTVLYRQLRRARTEYLRTTLKRCSIKRKRARADVFCEGWAAAVYTAIARLHPETALDPLIRRYLDERHAGLGTVKGREAGVRGQVAADDRARGRAQGREVRLHVGVETSRPTQAARRFFMTIATDLASAITAIPPAVRDGVTLKMSLGARRALAACDHSDGARPLKFATSVNGIRIVDAADIRGWELVA